MTKKTNWKSTAKNLAAKGLPLLGAAIGGAPAIAITTMLSKALGTNDPDELQAQIENLQKGDESYIKLKQLENDHEVELLNLSLAIERLAATDRQSAREREVSITKSIGTRDWNLYVLAWIVVIGFIGIIILFIFKPDAFASNAAAMMLLGSLSTGFGTVLAYFFGSSKGSSDKNKTIEKAMTYAKP